MFADTRRRFVSLFDDAPQRLLRSPVDAVYSFPWLDPPVLFALRRWYFPLSRLWAAANATGGDTSRFMDMAGVEAVGNRRRAMIGGILRRAGAAQRAAGDAAALWNQSLFDGGSPPADAAIEAARLAKAHRWMMARFYFYPLLYGKPVAPVAWRVPAAAEVEAIYGSYLDRPSALFACPDPMPSVQTSRPMLLADRRVRWLRFLSPSQRLADICHARVSEPLSGEALGTIVLGSGICVESDMIAGGADAATMALRLGLRVIEITSPWHSQRCPVGDYGGERFFATAPLGQIDLFAAQARESAVLIDWAHRHFPGKVALAGISLGSFVAQLVGSHSATWPAAARPDALMLITHSGRMEEVVFESGLVDSIGITEALAAAGWRERDMLRWAPLMNPGGDAAVPPESIVSVLGSADRVTPMRGGLELLRRWGVPAENRFLMRQGHFGSALKLLRDDKPLRRLIDILTR